MSIVTDIIQGNHDDKLDEIREAVASRRKVFRNQETAVAMILLKVGDIVELQGLRPKYVNGARGKITSKKRTKLVVDLDERTGRFFKNVVVPADHLKKV